MKEVKYRDFVREFAKWMKFQEPLKIIGVGGEMGYWVPQVHSKGLSALLMASQAHAMAQKNVDVDKTPVPSDDVKTCDKCEKSPAAWRGLVFHEGEQIEVEICHGCYRKYNPQGFKRM